MTAPKIECPNKTPEDCHWETVGENTGGFVLWCKHCGSVVDEDGTDLRQPKTLVKGE